MANSDIATAENSVSADPSIQGSTTGTGSTAPSQSSPVGDFITHAVNQATFQLPEGLTKGTPVAKGVNTLLGGIPQALINAAGGNEKLKETLARKSTAGTVGNVAGALAPLLVGQPESLLGNVAAGAAEQGARSAVTGDQDAAKSIGLGALGGGLGYGAGKVLGKAMGSLASKPEETIAEAANAAKKTYLANAIPDLTSRDFKQWVKNGAGGAGSSVTPEAAREEIGKLYSIIKENGLDNKAAQDAFRSAQPARWQAVNDAVEQSGLKLSDMGEELSNLDAVKNYQNVMKETAVSGQAEDPLTDIINQASGRVKGPNGYEEGPPRSFYDTRATLNSQADQAYKFSRNNALPAGNYQPEQQRALAQALQAVDDAYFNKATQMVSPEIANGIKSDWATQKLLGLAASRGETSIGGFRLSLGSATAARLKPGNIIGNVVGPTIQNITNGVAAPFIRGASGTAADLLSNPVVAGVAAKAAGSAGKLANPAALGTLGSAALGEGNESGGAPPMTPPSWNGGSTGGNPAGQPGTGTAGGTTPGGKTTVYPGAINSTTAQAVNARYGYPNSSLDDAILNGIDTLFNQKYKGELGGDPQAQAKFYGEYRDQMLKSLHSRPGKGIDSQLAARVLFPGQDEQQAQFIGAAKQNMQLTKLLHGDFQNGKPVGNGALDTGGPIKSLGRFLPGGAEKSANYGALKSMIEKEAGSPGAKAFDNIMYNPMFSREDKENAIRDLVKNGSNASGWQYYLDAIGGRK